MNLLNLKQSFRNLERNKIYSIINIAGIGMSTAFVLLVAAYVHNAMTLDHYSAEVKQLYRIEMNNLWSTEEPAAKKGFFDRLARGADEKLMLNTPVILAGDLKKNFPEIKDVCRITTFYDPVVRLSDRALKEGQGAVGLVDRNFFSVFGLSLVNGNAANAFLNNNSAVITESAAKKYFGMENPIGRVIRINDDEGQYIVSAIAKDFPSGSSIRFNLMIPVEGSTSFAYQLKQGLNTFSHLTIFNLQPKVNITDFRRKLKNFGNVYFGSFKESLSKSFQAPRPSEINLSFRPFSEGHYNISSPWFYFTDVKAMYQLLLLAVIALVIACLNYVLLSLSRVAARSHEAGVRKTVGAGWKHIIHLFLTETQVLVLLSVIFGFILALVALPYFSALTGVDLAAAEIVNWEVIATGLALCIVLTFIAGIYPALKMAGISPTEHPEQIRHL
ncbi:MAG TPA: ABC transporter permease [Flavisolibacter sp.]|nr:ABC transporter permease [Flavisolibacter sp.]